MFLTIISVSYKGPIRIHQTCFLLTNHHRQELSDNVFVDFLHVSLKLNRLVGAKSCLHGSPSACLIPITTL